jgi:PXPV repeat (3 copies)
MRCIPKVHAEPLKLYVAETRRTVMFIFPSPAKSTIRSPNQEHRMNHLFPARFFAVATLALGAVVAASAAHARSDVTFSIDVNGPGGYAQHQPVYVQPQPVYVQPRPVYVQPQPVYVQPRQGYHGQPHYVERRGPYGDRDGDGIANRFDRDSRHYDPRTAYGQGGRWDSDHDGVPNRFDRAPHDPYRY